MCDLELGWSGNMKIKPTVTVLWWVISNGYQRDVTNHMKKNMCRFVQKGYISNWTSTTQWWKTTWLEYGIGVIVNRVGDAIRIVNLLIVNVGSRQELSGWKWSTAVPMKLHSSYFWKYHEIASFWLCFARRSKVIQREAEEELQEGKPSWLDSDVRWCETKIG